MINLQDEKLLPSPEFLPPPTEQPKMSAKEFLKLTPQHELKNIFGIDSLLEPEEINFLHNGETPKGNTPESLLPIKSKETAKQKKDLFVNAIGNKITRSITVLILKIILVLLIIFLILYLWGGVVLSN